MVSTMKAKDFLLLFRGKSNTYVKNMLPREKPERGVKTKTAITSERADVNEQLMLRHLEGDFGVGICPICSDGRCYFGVIDIDFYGKQIRQMLRIIRDNSLPLVPFRSKSGGLHLYIMLQRSVGAKEMVAMLRSVVDTFCLDRLYGEGKVEVFPKQVSLGEDGFGSAVTLPYFNADNTYTYMLDLDGNPVGFGDALVSIRKSLTTAEKFAEVMASLSYSDAPPCIQRALLSGVVGDEDTGRNNFLFSYALYASKKWGDDFGDYVRAVNDGFASPVPSADVEATIKQVKAKEYSYKCKDIPCRSLCCKSECRNREYGLGRDKGHFSEVEFGQLTRYKAAEPYYVWEMRMHGSDKPFQRIVFRDEGELLDQKNFAKVCVRYLNFAPKQMQTNDWFSMLNKYIASVKDEGVSASSDTSETSIMRQMFVRYLSNKQSRRDSPYQIRVNLCVRRSESDGDGNIVVKYYFTHSGFAEYLRVNRVNFDPSLLRETLKGFGAHEDVLHYTSAAGKSVAFPCWSKEEDSDISVAYMGELEVAEADKASMLPVTDTSVEEKDETASYTDDDRKAAEEMF